VSNRWPGAEGGDFYIAAYGYASAEAGDLHFEAGERIEVTRRDGDWWTGRLGTRSLSNTYISPLVTTRSPFTPTRCLLTATRSSSPL
jgi:hypothetical protein